MLTEERNATAYELSVIVPVYQVEAYIEDCIRSLLMQEMEDMQLIFVNDGSMDGSWDIVRRYAQNDSRFLLLEKENGGLSSARNFGLPHAAGRYVLFVDSDDTVEPGSLARMLRRARQDDLDILQAFYQLIRGDSVEPVDMSRYDESIYTGREWLAGGYLLYGACFCLYRREFLEQNHLRFLEGVYHEDMDFTIHAAWKAGRVSAIPVVFYNYVMRGGSITDGRNLKRCKDLIRVADYVADWVRIETDPDIYDRFFREYLAFLYSHAVNLCILQKFPLTDLLSAEERREHVLAHLKDSRQKKYKLEYLLLKCKLYRLYAWLYVRIGGKE